MRFTRLKLLVRNILFFSRGQKRGLLVLLILLILIISANFFVTSYIEGLPLSSIDTVASPQLVAFIDNLEQKKQKPAIATTKKYDKYRSEKDVVKSSPIQTSLFKFDPNTADSSQFITLGLKPFVIKNILKYRYKGGRFHSPKDFKKIYGIKKEDYERLLPYISIEEATMDSVRKCKKDESSIIHKDIIVELNSADTTSLKQLRGIGSYFAKQIIYYRKQLGGYYSINQLLEIKNFSQERFDVISHQLKVDTTKIYKININRLSIEKLKRHPYINFYQAKAIYELRYRAKITDINSLKNLDEFSAEDFDKIKPYIRLD